MEQLFNVFDRNHDGSITIKEIEEVIDLIKNDKDPEIEIPNIEQIKIALKQFDANRTFIKFCFNQFSLKIN